MTAGSWVRAVRRSRRLSVRELAELAGIPRTTVSRIETGQTVPRLDTFVRLILAAGYDLAAVDEHGRLLALDPVHDELRDHGGRHFPAHLGWDRTPGYIEGGWWGWYRVAWWFQDQAKPDFTYWRRREQSRYTGRDTDCHEIGRVWDDAT